MAFGKNTAPKVAFEVELREHLRSKIADGKEEIASLEAQFESLTVHAEDLMQQRIEVKNEQDKLKELINSLELSLGLEQTDFEKED